MRGFRRTLSREFNAVLDFVEGLASKMLTTQLSLARCIKRNYCCTELSIYNFILEKSDKKQFQKFKSFLIIHLWGIHADYYIEDF